jgi:exopolyphosphatase/guanosine-5'-triphosphate,3'-diphosphate pyrophosphatase
MKRIAAIDIGSQTIRLLIADCDAETLYPVERDREIVRLGSGMHRDCLLLPEKIEQASACIERFCKHARSQGAGEILAVATASVRKAKNRLDFIDQIRETSGIAAAIIDEQQEAEFSRLGVLAVIPGQTGHSIIIDIGGGSTEFSFLHSGILMSCCSLPMGVIEPAERCMRADPLIDAEIKALRTWVASMVSSHAALFPRPEPGIVPAVIATAGTATTLAAMDQQLSDYTPARINGYHLSLDSINNLLDTMLRLPREQRAAMAGLETGRATVIVPGALILGHLLQYFGCAGCTISDAGLLEGIIIRHAALKKIIEKA